MELEGTLDFERPRTRRWIPVVAVVLPVTGFVIVAAWFIRAYVAPPMVAIPAPMALAAAPPAIPTRPLVSYRSEPAEAAPVQAAPEPQRSAETPVHAPSLPVFASLSNGQSSFPMPPMPAASPFTAPQAPVTTAYADPTPEADAAIEASEPIQGPIPLPLHKPRLNLARIATGPVPLPRPRPPEANPAPQIEQPLFDRHAVQ